MGVLVVLIVAGCGSNDKKAATSGATSPPSSSSKGSAEVVKLSADPGGALKFTTTKLTAKAGKVTLEMANASKIGHGVGIEGGGVDVDGPVVGAGKKSTATADLKPGRYEFYCPVKSHRQAGMQGTLVVR